MRIYAGSWRSDDRSRNGVGVKHRLFELSRRGVLRILATLTIALGCSLPVLAQAPIPKTRAPHRIDDSLRQALGSVQQGQSVRAITRWPNDIERSLGSIAGSMAGSSVYSPASTTIARSPVAVPASTTNLAMPQSTQLIENSRSHEVAGVPQATVINEPSFPVSTTSDVVIPPPIAHGPMAGQLDSYRARAFELQESTRPLVEPPDRIAVHPWWQDVVPQPLGMSSEILPIAPPCPP